jgi:hypothetical protein
MSPDPAWANRTASTDEQRLEGDEALMRGEAALAAQWYRSAANQGDPVAQTRLGWLYREGNGVGRDHEQARLWFTQAALQGNSGGQFSLGTLYEHGRGVPRNPAEAARWYRLAADQGHAGAQNNLGWLYQNGQGLPRDPAEAARWYRLAADQGQPDALGNLGLLHLHGQGVPLNPAEGERLLRQAAAYGDREAGEIVRQLEAERRQRANTRAVLEQSPIYGLWRTRAPLVDQGLRRMYLTLEIRRNQVVFQYDCRFLDGSILIGSFTSRAEILEDRLKILDGGRSEATNAENSCAASVNPTTLPYRLDPSGLAITFGGREIALARAGAR